MYMYLLCLSVASSPSEEIGPALVRMRPDYPRKCTKTSILLLVDLLKFSLTTLAACFCVLSIKVAYSKVIATACLNKQNNYMFVCVEAVVLIPKSVGSICSQKRAFRAFSSLQSNETLVYNKITSCA